jgi:hypothetical protein
MLQAYTHAFRHDLYMCTTIWMEELAKLTAVEGFVVGDAEVLEHVGVAGEQWSGEGQEGGAGGEEDGGELIGRHGQVLLN